MSRRPEVLDDEMARVLRGMTGAERLKIADGMFSSARRMIASHLAAEHPGGVGVPVSRDRLDCDQAAPVFLAASGFSPGAGAVPRQKFAGQPLPNEIGAAAPVWRREIHGATAAPRIRTGKFVGQRLPTTLDGEFRWAAAAP